MQQEHLCTLFPLMGKALEI